MSQTTASKYRICCFLCILLEEGTGGGFWVICFQLAQQGDYFDLTYFSYSKGRYNYYLGAVVCGDEFFLFEIVMELFFGARCFIFEQFQASAKI